MPISLQGKPFRVGAATARLAALTTVALVAVAACDADTKPTETKDTTMPSTTPAPDYPLNQPVMVTPDNFVRAETDREFALAVSQGGFGAFHHLRELMPIDHQTVVRPNRDTIYSSAVFDLDAGPVTVTLPDAGNRFRSMQVITEDEYTPEVIYRPGTYTYDRAQIGTRYVLLALRTFVDPNDPADVDAVHRLQDSTKVSQPKSGTFEIPQWDPASQQVVRDALLTLASTLPNTDGAFGPRDKVDPINHLIGSASAWGGNPPEDAEYLTVTPGRNDGNTIYRLRVKDVPVDGFWSISVYNSAGQFQPNSADAYTVNNVTAKADPDGAVDIQFGGCDPTVLNCLPIEPGWNYTVRLYRPQAPILNGQWTFPEATPVS